MFDFDQPVGFTIFCDDIRQEIGGKTSLIGIYESIMIIHVPFPATLPKFGFHIEMFEPANLTLQRDFPIEFRISLPGDEEDKPSLLGTLAADPERAKEAFNNLASRPTAHRPGLAHITTNLVSAPFSLKEPGLIRVRAKYTDDDRRCGNLR